MLFLILGIIANTSLIFFIKQADVKGCNRNAVVCINYIVGTVFSIIYSTLLDLHIFDFSSYSFSTLLLGSINGIAMVVCMLLQQKSIYVNGAGISTTFNRLGIIVPTILSIFLFNEYPNIINALGISISILAIIMSYDKMDSNKKSYILLFAILVIGGLIDFDSKLYSQIQSSNGVGGYIFISFLISAFFSTINQFRQSQKSISPKELIFGILMGVANVMITFAVVSASAELPAYLLFPVYGGGVIILVNMLDMILYKTKLTRRESLGTIMVIISIVLLNIK